MRGDRVEVVVDVGDGVRTFDIIATRAGRRVEVSVGRTAVEVVEVTRTGQPVRTARFLASRRGGRRASDGRCRRRRRAGWPQALRRADENQASLGIDS